MFEVTVVNALVYGVLFALTYYVLLSVYFKRFLKIQWARLLFYVTAFSLFGVSGEVLVNNVWELLFQVPLWEYQLFPAHGGDISYFFVFIWGSLGYYRYLNDTYIHNFGSKNHLKPGLIMGAEAIVLELAYNGLFLLLFGSYIFYYLPANLGPLSHLSCLEVIPFYFIVGLFTRHLVVKQDALGYKRGVWPTIAVFWMIIVTLVFF